VAHFFGKAVPRPLAAECLLAVKDPLLRAVVSTLKLDDQSRSLCEQSHTGVTITVCDPVLHMPFPLSIQPAIRYTGVLSFQ